MATSKLADAAATMIAAEKKALELAVAASSAFQSAMQAALDELSDIPESFDSPARRSINQIVQQLAYPMQEVNNRLATYNPAIPIQPAV